MITIKARTTNEAWKKTLTKLLKDGEKTDNDKYYRDELILIEITSPFLEKIDPLFPMKQDDIDSINTFIISGKHEDTITHEWTKIYHHRMFDEPNSQIKYLISFLQKRPLEGEALISMWDKFKDQNQKISPCTEIIWARVKFNKLELHVHAHSSDANKKLLMNIQEFVSVQVYIAQQLGVDIGNYYHIIDSCHIHKKDISHAQELIKKLSSTSLQKDSNLKSK